MNIINFTPLTVMFTPSDINSLRAVTSGSYPQPSIVYKAAPTGNYALYEHSSGSWRHSSLVTNARLLECVNILNSSKKEIADDIEDIGLSKPELKSDVLSEFAKENNIPVEHIGSYQKPTETLFNLNNLDITGKTFKINKPIPDCLKINPEKESVKETNSGGACDYYRVGVTHPMSKDQVPYIAECGDIMESLEMTYAEANIFKEIWRTAAERTLGLKKAGNSNVRAAEKVVFFADRYYQQNVHGANLTDSRKVTK